MSSMLINMSISPDFVVVNKFWHSDWSAVAEMATSGVRGIDGWWGGSKSRGRWNAVRLAKHWE